MKIFLGTAGLGLLGWILLTGMTPGEEGEEEPYRSTDDGVYTQDQAKRGERAHREACLHCHLPDFYKGGLIDSWAGNTVGAFNLEIVNTMPQDRPSSLKSQEYADIMAFLLRLTGFPAGEEELPSDDADLAKIVIARSKK